MLLSFADHVVVNSKVLPELSQTYIRAACHPMSGGTTEFLVADQVSGQACEQLPAPNVDRSIFPEPMTS